MKIGFVDKLVEQGRKIAELERALDESVKLQSHYAVLLNVIDRGKRLTFDNGQDWLDRLRYLASQDPLRRNHDERR